MNLEQATRNQARIKMALKGPSGSGKTMSSLLLAYGLSFLLDIYNRTQMEQ